MIPLPKCARHKEIFYSEFYLQFSYPHNCNVISKRIECITWMRINMGRSRGKSLIRWNDYV